MCVCVKITGELERGLRPHIFLYKKRNVCMNVEKGCE